ncbi:MAG: hypothetical protein QXS02_05885 [Candidatus Thermoplasmatota archaeon]
MVMSEDFEKQKEEIIQRLEEIYNFGCIEDYVSLDIILDPNSSYDDNIKYLQDYLSEELLPSIRGHEIEKLIGNEYFIRLKEDVNSGEFEKQMSKDQTKNNLF